MFEVFFYGLQQDIKLFLFFPILSAIFRIVFIKMFPLWLLVGHGFQCLCFSGIYDFGIHSIGIL